MSGGLIWIQVCARIRLICISQACYFQGNGREVHIDYAGLINAKWTLVTVDAYSKCIDAHVVSSLSAAVVTEQILGDAFVIHGGPDVIVLNNAHSFTSEEFSKWH